jgi:ribosomal protein S27E
MKIDYKNKVVSQNIDINELRPNKSYSYLVENRNSSFKDLLKNKEEMDKFLINRNCPICESSHNTFEFDKDSFKVVKCNICKVIFVNPIFNEKKYKEIYQSKDYQNIVKELGESSHSYRKKRFGKERANIIEKFHNKNL